jgi:hypothetical protein
MKRIYSVLVENRSGVLCMVIGLSHGKAVNIKTSSGEQTGYLAQNTGTVLYQYGIYSLHFKYSSLPLFYQIHRIDQTF